MSELNNSTLVLDAPTMNTCKVNRSKTDSTGNIDTIAGAVDPAVVFLILIPPDW